MLGLRMLIKCSYALGCSPADLFPLDFNSRKTNGDRFLEISKSVDLVGQNFLLNICKDYASEYRRVKDLRK